MMTYQKSFGMNPRERLQIDFSTFLTTSLVAQNDKQLKEIALRVVDPRLRDPKKANFADLRAICRHALWPQSLTLGALRPRCCAGGIPLMVMAIRLTH
jgi:hypothetical protein